MSVMRAAGEKKTNATLGKHLNPSRLINAHQHDDRAQIVRIPKAVLVRLSESCRIDQLRSDYVVQSQGQWVFRKVDSFNHDHDRK